MTFTMTKWQYFGIMVVANACQYMFKGNDPVWWTATIIWAFATWRFIILLRREAKDILKDINGDD